MPIKNVVLSLFFMFAAANHSYAADSCELTMALSSHKVTNSEEIINEISGLLKDTLGAAEIEPATGMQLSMGDFKAKISSSAGERQSPIKVNIGNRTSVIMLPNTSTGVTELQIFISVNTAKELLGGAITPAAPQAPATLAKEIAPEQNPQSKAKQKPAAPTSKPKQKDPSPSTAKAPQQIDDVVIASHSTRSAHLVDQMKMLYENALVLDPTTSKIPNSAFQLERIAIGLTEQERLAVIGRRIRKVRLEILGLTLEEVEERSASFGDKSKIARETLRRFEIGEIPQMKNIVLANRIKDVFIKIFERDNLKKAAIDFDSAQESRQLLVTLSKIAKLLHTTKQINVDTSLVQIRDALGFSAEDFAALIGDGSGGKSQLNSLTTKGLHIARLALEDELVSNPNLQVRPVLSKQLAAVELLLTKAASQIPGLKIVDVAGFSENQQVIMKFDMLYNVLRDYYKMPQKNLLNIVARKYDFSPFLRDAYRVQSSINRNPDPSAKRTGNSVPDFYVHEILKVAENIMDTTTPTIP